jgi:hypothetical protein
VLGEAIVGVPEMTHALVIERPPGSVGETVQLVGAEPVLVGVTVVIAVPNV